MDFESRAFAASASSVPYFDPTSATIWGEVCYIFVSLVVRHHTILLVWDLETDARLSDKVDQEGKLLAETTGARRGGHDLAKERQYLKSVVHVI
jgi:hypothetical protein